MTKKHKNSSREKKIAKTNIEFNVQQHSVHFLYMNVSVKFTCSRFKWKFQTERVRKIPHNNKCDKWHVLVWGKRGKCEKEPEKLECTRRVNNIHTERGRESAYRYILYTLLLYSSCKLLKKYFCFHFIFFSFSRLLLAKLVVHMRCVAQQYSRSVHSTVVFVDDGAY